MRIVAFSDSHGLHHDLEMPRGDVLVIAGDICAYGTIMEVVEFNAWLGTLDYQKVLLVPGNHDAPLADPFIRQVLSNATLLIDEGAEFEGVKFYGTPWVTIFGDWEFQLPEEELERKYAQIPDDTDVLITHMPPRGINDLVLNRATYINVGSESLLSRVNQLSAGSLKLHCFGHLHEPKNKKWNIQRQGTAFANVSVLDERYRLVTQPKVFEL